jgi:FKBP-type peptidyl-prolyl cis-trans isomerase FkpA
MKVNLILVTAVAIVAVVALALYFGAPRQMQSQQTADTDTHAAPEEQSGPPPEVVWRAAQDAFLNHNREQPGWSESPEGLQYHVDTEASGDSPKPAPGSRVTVHYEGRLIDGRVFDSSYMRGEPATFPLSGVIEGWQIGVPMMRKGETWTFAIPASLAYGEANAGPIPPGSTLIFKVELLEVETPA